MLSCEKVISTVFVAVHPAPLFSVHVKVYTPSAGTVTVALAVVVFGVKVVPTGPPDHVPMP